MLHTFLREDKSFHKRGLQNNKVVSRMANYYRVSELLENSINQKKYFTFFIHKKLSTL